MIGLWLRGTLVGRTGRLIGSIAGLALTVALLASLGTFIASSGQTMARRAIANVPVDWQVLLAPTADATRVVDAIRQTAAPADLRSVGYADTAGLSATTGSTTQTTGAGKVVGIESDYSARFPDQIHVILGAPDGVLIATQTAANLHVTVGDTVSVQRIGLPPVDVRIAGVATLPNTDSMFPGHRCAQGHCAPGSPRQRAGDADGAVARPVRSAAQRSARLGSHPAACAAQSYRPAL